MLLQKGFLVGLILLPSVVFAAAKKPPEVPSLGKKVVALAPVKNIQIEMPNRQVHNFGEDYQASLTTRLTQMGRYIVTDVISQSSLVQRVMERFVWPGSVTPSATIHIEVDAFNFVTGARGDRTFYGFDERYRNEFNDGTGERFNEFPLRVNSMSPSWFGDTFRQKGIVPFDSRSGLDLGDGFSLNFLFAWLRVKYARYHSELHLRLKLDSPFDSASSYRWVKVRGDGFFFDVSGAYEGFSAGIAVARKDAMSQALKKAIDGSVDAIDRALRELPMLAKIDAVLKDGTILMGTGPFSDVKPDVLYELVDEPSTRIQVSSSVSSGSIGKLVSGDYSQISAGKLLRQVQGAPLGASIRMSGIPSVVESISLPNENFSRSSLQGLVPEISTWLAFLRSIGEAIFLPYRIWRYFMYDQHYHRNADGRGWRSFDLANSEWSKQIGLQSAPEMQDEAPIVAVLDSGIDYNHPVLHHLLWLNSSPSVDENSRQDRYGWDFVSNDSSPFDDHYHGTQIASLVATVAPHARILPVKVFNPWGITSSAAIYAGFTYAVDHGAKILVCGWSTIVPSEALRKGIEYARDHGVLVVSAAGDQGVSLDRWKVYPASFADQFDNLVVVTGVNSQNKLFHYPERKANFGTRIVKIAAPADAIRVAEPRLGESNESSTGLAAAIVAGVLARNLSARQLTGTYQDWIVELLNDAQPVRDLESYVQGGRVVQVQK